MIELELVVGAYKGCLTEVWGDDLPYVLDAVRRCVCPWRDALTRFQASTRSQTERSYVYSGERTRHAAQYRITRILMLALDECNPDFRINFSGGMRDRMSLGELPGPQLYTQFLRTLARDEVEAFLDRLEVDSLSWNTALQADRVVHDAEVHGFKNIFLVIAREHITRFTAVMVHCIKRRGLEAVSIIPIPYGEWNEVVDSKLTLAREAFGPRTVIEGDDLELETVISQRAGQCGEAWKLSYDKQQSGDWPIGGVHPRELLEFLENQPIQL